MSLTIEKSLVQVFFNWPALNFTSYRQGEPVKIYYLFLFKQIERWWRELHNRLEKFFKRQLRMLLEKGYYDPDDEMDRHMLAFVFIPVIQKEMDIFKETIWNSHRVRSQKEARMPKGIPNHLYSFPESYGAQECGMLTG